MTSCTWLFVPGSAPNRFDKAAGSGADEVILDLEDTVGAGEKEAARGAVVEWLAQGGRGWVRTNPAGSPWGRDDLAALADAQGLVGVMVPKAEDPVELGVAGGAVGRPVVALVETARGVLDARRLAAVDGVTALAFGSLDFILDVGVAHDADVVWHARSELVLASRSLGLSAPIDGVTSAVRDDALVHADAVRAKVAGFGGKLCIHPAQVEPAARGFAPSREEIAWARDILAAIGDDTLGVGIDGTMVDRPVIERARRILRTSGSDISMGAES
ncbi:HpcH/HpaI aldolase/citrate lyase family protein [Aeromicrobium sp. CTD01-1L150]|uniref:HpcH/HpaI aldolase/citrate lyase family protein n=1 Tax=Aeromicrobium sp. CTD01-1L150 TaxID=3341830 RepID=UPI0035C0FFD0